MGKERIGFGLILSDSQGFMVKPIHDGGTQLLRMQGPDSSDAAAVAYLDAKRWQAIEGHARAEFNRRLPEEYRGTWGKGWARLDSQFGKELALLFWIAEPPTPAEALSDAVKAWLELAPEERWWLYTTTNATSNHPAFGPTTGWRMAVKTALAGATRDSAAPHAGAIPAIATPTVAGGR